ncbi:MAG: amidohydrolase family protein [Alphaproteobacteria bacterium]
MTLSKQLLIGTILTAGLSGLAFADENKTEKWDVNNPPGVKKEISIDVTEGTWMSLDVSPDGQTIAFDLLGDIYTMPVTGGTAKNISSGLAWEYQPRFSPDGKRIAFTSDRAGGDNIWTMNVDGSEPEQITKETFRLLNNPTWSPDGQFIAAKKHFTTSRSLGTGEIWLYHTSGGSGVQLVKKPSDTHQKELGEPMFSPDGRYIYYTRNITPGATFIYAQDSNTELFNISRYDMETGKISKAAGGAGGAVRPAPSPDGKYLAYVKRKRAKSMLFLKDLESGHERMIFDHLDQDMQETWAVQGVYPNMDWSPDSKSIFFWAKGKIHRLDVADDNIEHIDFRVKDKRQVLQAPRPEHSVSTDSFKSLMPRYVQVSPNGRDVIYESLGKLYVRSTTGGEARRLTNLPEHIRELDAAWSRDGQTIAFVSWTDKDLAKVHTTTLSGAMTNVTRNPGHYRRPTFSPDGRSLAFEKGAGGHLTAPEWSDETGIYVSTLGGEPKRVRSSGSNPHFGTSSDRIFVTGGHNKQRSLISTDLAGGEERVHASSKLAQTYFMSPNGKTIAFRQNYNLFVMPALSGPQNVATGPKATALPVKKVSTNGATYPSWSNDGQTLNWSLGPKLYQADVKAVMKDGPDAAKNIAKISPVHQADKPEGRVALINARIITMKDRDGGVIESGTIITNGDRIEAIGNPRIPSDAKIVDLKGKTVIPGFIDAHAHGPQGAGDLTPEQNWSAIGHLALGVTTVFDPSSSAASIFPAAEFQRAGKLLAPRIFSTGEVIYGAKAPGFFADITNKDDALEHVTRLLEQGAHGVKNYNQPRREQRQQVAHAARELDMLVVPEGGSLYHMDMSLIADGNSSVEHNIPVLEIYDDVVQMYSQTDVAYVPTLVVTYGGVRGEDYYYQESDVWKHPILSKHVPPTVLQARSVRRQMAPIEDYADADSAAVAKKLEDAGVLVSIGAHGQREGLAAHWEIWSFARGGMDPVQALRTATVNPAKHLGFFQDIGSLEKGKLADLVILDANPLDNIRNTDKIDRVMLGGRLYDASTMDETVTGTKKRAPYWWED